MERTPLRNAVPCLDDLWNKVKEFVKENQGKKGYIDTQSDSHDTIYTFVYFDDAFQTYEMKVHGVRVNPGNDDLEIIYDSDTNGHSARIEYDEDDFGAPEADWRSVRWDDGVYYTPTIFNLGEFLEEYLQDEVNQNS